MTSLQVMYYFGYAEIFAIPSDRSGMVAICVARQPPSGPEVKMGCVELCNFHFCCASIFCQPMKKFEFFGATRATRQRHSKRVALGTRMPLVYKFELDQSERKSSQVNRKYTQNLNLRLRLRLARALDITVRGSVTTVLLAVPTPPLLGSCRRHNGHT